MCVFYKIIIIPLKNPKPRYWDEVNNFVLNKFNLK